MGSFFRGKAVGSFGGVGFDADFDSFGDDSSVATVVVAGEADGPASGVSEPQPLRPTVPDTRILRSRNFEARFIAKVSVSVRSR